MSGLRQTASSRRAVGAVLTALVVAGLVAATGLLFAELPGNAPTTVDGRDRSPVDAVLTPDEQWLLTANQTAGTVSLVHVSTGKVTAERACGQRPAALTLTPDGRRVLVSAAYAGTMTVLDIKDGKLIPAGAVHLSFEPRGIAVAPDGKTAYVALTTGDCVAVVDLEKLNVSGRIAVGRWPRYLAMSPDGRRLAVGVSGDGGVAVVDTAAQKLLYVEDFMGLNLGQMQVSGDGKYVYFPWMTYRQQPISPGNIRQGWVLASRIARVKLDGKARREAISLDPQGKAVSDPHGLALSPDEQWLVASTSGTHELLVYRLAGLPFQDYGGPGDHINTDLLKDRDRFGRIPLGGRPMALRFSRDGKHVYVANYLLNCVQVVDLEARKLVRTIELGGVQEPSLARRGEAIFYDGQRSLDQWYSCHSCHYEGHTNAVLMDNRSDGRNGYAKTVLSLRNIAHTGPYRWNGWQKTLEEAVRKSMADTMQAKPPAHDDVKALIAFLETLAAPPNPHRDRDGKRSEAALRGQKIFESDRAGCARCHAGPFFTDGRIHNVGLGAPGDVYKGYKTPSLIHTFDRVLYLHDGRSRNLEELLKGPHSPTKVSGMCDLSEEELRHLIAYLRSL